MKKVKGQIGIGALISIMIPVFVASIGMGWQSLARANDAVDRTAKVESEIAAMNVKLDFLVKHEGGIILGPIGEQIKIVTSTKT